MGPLLFLLAGVLFTLGSVADRTNTLLEAVVIALAAIWWEVQN